MTIIVETGAVVAGANSYALTSDLTAFAAARAQTITGDDTALQALLIRAMDYIEPLNWVGDRFSLAQPLEWPRKNVRVENFCYLPTQLPQQLVFLQCCVALEYSLSGELMPTAMPNDHGSVTAEAVTGAVSIAYANNGRILKVAAIEKAQRFIDVLTRPRYLRAVRT